MQDAAALQTVEEAAELLSSGRGLEAESVLMTLLNQQSDDVSGWFLLGEALMQRGEIAQARAAFMRASLSPARDAAIDENALKVAAARRAEALLEPEP